MTMAEFPELGKKCSLEACNKLDFTPFLCSACKKYFCGVHRLYHGCPFENVSSGTNLNSHNKPLKPYLCSLEGCFACESIRIECGHCGFTFCLRHRYPEEHHCSSQDVKTDQSKMTNQQELRKKVERIITTDNESNTFGVAMISTQPKDRVMSDVERKRADRLAIMRLKSVTRNCDVPPADQMFLFLVRDGKRDPVAISKNWTIGRCIDHIAKQFSIPNNNATFGAKLLRLYSDANHSEPLPMADIVREHFSDLSNVFIKTDQ